MRSVADQPRVTHVLTRPEHEPRRASPARQQVGRIRHRDRTRLWQRSGARRALLYSASDIDVLDLDAERAHPFLSRLAPDILSQAPSVEDLAARLTQPRYERRQLGAVLLDQGFVAGLGNYLRAEILFEARVQPRRRAADLEDEEILRKVSLKK